MLGLVAAGLLMVGGPGAGAAAGGDSPQSVFASDSVTHLGTLPEAAAAISMQFSSDSPHLYVSTLKGLHVYDISDPTAPGLITILPLPHYQNEAMSLGERPNGDKFVIIASTLAAASTRGDVDPGTARYLIVVDVTDPEAPEVVGSLATKSRTHTVSCADKACRWAYSDGRSQGVISIIDLRNFREPKMAGTYASVVPQGHDQDLDDAGILWHVGGQGAVALDISDRTKPVPLNSTNGEGVGNPDRENNPYNNFILHNSTRPHAKRFRPGTAPSLRRGNVLLATEEDTDVGACGPELGTFQTWHIDYLDADRYARANPKGEPGGGSIEPLDKWYPSDAAVGHACSAHYFDYHSGGFVAQGFYELGTRILDVRDPSKIKQVGYFFAPDMETWAAYWVPKRNKKGRVTGRPSNIVYTADVARGIDILRVELPGSSPRKTKAVAVTGVPAATLEARQPLSRPSREWGWACRIPGA